jgi:hypothetical protein
VAILLAAPALAQQPPATEAPTGSMEGTVLDAITGEPVRTAQVDLNGDQAQGGAETDLTAATDANGHFAFRALPAGSYWLYAQRLGYESPGTGASQIALASGERKSGIEIRLFPPGSISGKVVDELGAPVVDCPVSALEPRSQGGRRSMSVRGSASTNARGGYSIPGLQEGRYYVSVRCEGELEAPHPLMPAGDPGRPTLAYAPQFYPGPPDANGATRLKVAPGIETRGVDFQVHRVPGTTVRVRVDVADPSLLQRVHVALLPPSLDYYQGPAIGSDVDRHTGEVQFRAVIPGSYILVAQTSGDGPLYYAQLPVRVGATPPDPIHVVLAPAATMNGTLQVEGDNPPALDSFPIMLEPLGGFVFGRPAAHVNKDGTFTLADVTPGKWRLSLGPSGVPYVKSLSIGDKDVSPYGFDLAPGAAGPIRILASTKTGRVGASTQGGGASFLLVPTDPERFESGHLRLGATGRGEQATLPRVVPGRYHLFALNGSVRSIWHHLPEFVNALGDHAQLVEVSEGQTVQATPERIEADQLKEALEEAEAK